MDLCAFALWKYKNIEGILMHMRSSEVTLTKYVNPKMPALIRYDYEQEEMTVEFPENKYKLPVTCSFNDATKTLQELKMYELR